MALNIGPTSGFMSNMRQNLPGMINSIAQNYGDPNLRGPAAMTAQMQRRKQATQGKQPMSKSDVNKPPMPNPAPLPTQPGAGQINTAPSGNLSGDVITRQADPNVNRPMSTGPMVLRPNVPAYIPGTGPMDNPLMNTRQRFGPDPGLPSVMNTMGGLWGNYNRLLGASQPSGRMFY